MSRAQGLRTMSGCWRLRASTCWAAQVTEPIVSIRLLKLLAQRGNPISRPVCGFFSGVFDSPAMCPRTFFLCEGEMQM
jgi:hypothetical protein